MNYEDLFPRPITEMTDEEIIARATELREQNAIPKFSSTKAPKAPKLVTGGKPSTPKLSKAEEAMQQILANAEAKRLAKEQGKGAENEETSSGNPGSNTPS